MSHRCCRRLLKTCCYVVCLLPCSVVRVCFCKTLQAQNTTKDFKTNFSNSARGVTWMMMLDDPTVVYVVGVIVVFILLLSPLRNRIIRWLRQSPKGLLQGFFQCAPCIPTWIKLRVFFWRRCYGKKNQNGNGDPEKGYVGTPNTDSRGWCWWPCPSKKDDVSQLRDETDRLKQKNRDLESKCKKLENLLQACEDNASHLKGENTRLQGEVSAFKMRLSKMASEKMRDDNPTVEDLNDPRRPTALVSRWTSLFRCGEYWTAYENVKPKEGESDAASILHRICQATYDTTKQFVEDLIQILIDEVSHRRSPEQTPADQTRRQTLEKFIPDKDERESILGSLEYTLKQMVKGNSEGKGQEGKAILRLLRSRNPPTSLSLAVTSAVGELEHIRSFVDQLTELIYYMRVQDIKVVVDFDCKAGTRLNLALYEVESGKTVNNPKSAVVKAVMRPALLRHEQGPVLCKGEVELVTSAKPQPGNNSNTPTPDVGTPKAADLAAFDEKNARQSTVETASTDEENKPASQSTRAAVVMAEQSQQSSLAVAGKANPSLQKGMGDSKRSAVNPNGGVHDGPAAVGLAAQAGTDQATALKQENTVTDTSLQPPQNDHNQQEVDRSEAASTTAAASPAPPEDQGTDTVITMDDGENEVGLLNK